MTALDFLKQKLGTMPGTATVRVLDNLGGDALIVDMSAGELLAGLGVVVAPPATVITRRIPLGAAHSTADEMNVRDAPAGRVVTMLPNGTNVTVLGTPLVSAALAGKLHTWAHITHHSGDGWCDEALLAAHSAVVPPVRTVHHRFGLHVLQDGRGTADAFLASLPAGSIPTATIVNDPGAANDFAERGIKTIYRWEDGGEGLNVPDNGDAAEAYGHQLLHDRLGSGHYNVDRRCYIQIENEVTWSPGHGRFWLGLLAEADAQGYKAVIGAYAVGQPEPNEWATMADALHYAAAHGHVVAMHVYSARGTPPGELSADVTDYETRFMRLYAAVPDNARPPLIVSEFQGEFARGAFQGAAALISLCEKFEAATASADYLLGYNIWTVGKAGNWEDACIDSALPNLAAWRQL